jgi:hypothetical protein
MAARALSAKTLPQPEWQPPQTQDHEFDPQKFTAWVEKNIDPQFQKAFLSITGLIKRISFPIFKQALNAALLEVNLGPEKHHYVLVAKGKSNEWVAGLAASQAPPKLLGQIHYLALGHEDACEFVATMGTIPSKQWPKSIILFDDASYSGNQMTRHVTKIMDKLGEDPTISRKIHIVIPYITLVALNRLKNIKKPPNIAMTISYNTVMPTLKGLIENISPKNFEILQRFYAELDVHLTDKEGHDSGISTYYFDHKIPNDQSFILGKFGRECMPRIKPPYC